MSRLRIQFARAFELLIRVGVGCFILIVGGVVVLGFLISVDRRSTYRPSVAGPRRPIPVVDPAVLTVGEKLYQTEGCENCHGSIGNGPTSTDMPDLTHEGRRNADIEWQMLNLREHHRLFRPSSMPDYTDLSPDQLRALASYMATRH
jgi:cytochrome c553